MKILCYRNVRVPSTTAHSLYGVRSCAFLSRVVPVCMIASRGKSGHPFESLYDLNVRGYPHLSIVTPPVRHKGLGGLWKRALARRWLRNNRRDRPVVYLSQRKTTKYFARLKSRPGLDFVLVLECHDPDEGWTEEVRAADGLIYTSESLRAVMTEKFPYLNSRPSLVLHHKIDDIPDTPPCAHFEKEPQEPFLLCYAGSVLPWKDLDTTIEAMKRLPDRFRLRIIGGSGEDPYRKHLVQKSSELGLRSRVEFIPFIPMAAVRRCAQEADAMILTLSTKRRFRIPCKLLDYFSWTRPVIAADLDCIREVIRHGENGLLFEPESAESLAQQVRSLAAMSALGRHAMVAKGVETLKPFSVDHWLTRFFDWLHGVVRLTRAA